MIKEPRIVIAEVAGAGRVPVACRSGAIVKLARRTIAVCAMVEPVGTYVFKGYSATLRLPKNLNMFLDADYAPKFALIVAIR